MNNYELLKGIVLGKNSEIINGFFLMKKEKKNNYILKKSLGLMNYLDSVFFGLLDFSSENSGFKIDIGILDDNLVLFFGSFKQDLYDFPIYNFDNGEKITFNEDSVVLVERFSDKKSEGIETLFSNSFFNFGINSNKITLEIFDKLLKNDDNSKIKAKLELNKNNNSLIYLNFNFTQNKEINDKIEIKPLNFENNFENLTLKECYLNYEKYRIKIIFNDENSIIICNDDNFNMKNFRGYEIKFSSNEDIKKINEIKEIKVKEIINKTDENEEENFNNFKPLILNCLFENILNIFKETFDYNLNKFDINYCDIIKKNNNNFNIDKEKIYINFLSEQNLLVSYSKNKKKFKKKEFFVKNLNKMTLNEIFPDLSESKILTENEIEKIFNNQEKNYCKCKIF
jgi:hypothetical protein